MINLLPPEKKKELLHNKTERLIIILGVVFLTFLISLTLVFFLIEAYLESQVVSKEVILEINQKEYESDKIQNLKDKIGEYNENLFEISNFYENQIYFSDNIDKVVNLKLNDISFHNFSLKKEEEKNVFYISGFSKERGSLVSFRESLRQESMIENVSFSPLSWAKPQNIDFQVTFNFKNE